MTFTKAPWKLYRHNHAPTEIDVMADGWLLASVYTPGDVPDNRPIQEANARLIAKAPEMFELLKERLSDEDLSYGEGKKIDELLAEIEGKP